MTPPTAGEGIAALLLPPLGVYLARGPGAEFGFACMLTVLGFVPGVLFALYCVIAPRDRIAAA